MDSFFSCSNYNILRQHVYAVICAKACAKNCANRGMQKFYIAQFLRHSAESIAQNVEIFPPHSIL